MGSSSLAVCPPSLFSGDLHRRPFPCSIAARRRRRRPSVPSQASRNVDASWAPTERNGGADNYGGWFESKREIENRNGFPKIVVAGVGTSAAIAIAALTYFSFERKGFKLCFDAPLHTLQMLMPTQSTKVPVEVPEPTAIEDNQALEAMMEDKPDISSDALEENKNHTSALRAKKRVIVPVAADTIQQEALTVLKKLKIIENDASADELCTRREYARWLVKANSTLERDPQYRIVPTILLAGSTVAAFDDVTVNDPDFWYIQALAEAGIVLSKLSNGNPTPSDMDSPNCSGRLSFSPESLVSRFDLVNWKAMLEYSFTSETKKSDLFTVQILRTKVGLLDVSASSPDISPELLMDLTAGDKSIIRRAFGNIRLLQPQKPVTKAQAAVALISGRMSEAVHNELTRLEAENQSKLAEIEEIRSELIHRGDMQRFWEEQFNKEKERGLEVQNHFCLALLDLENFKVARDRWLSEYIKEKAALDCQQQLLFNLQEEVDGMSDKLASERANFLTEKKSLEKLFSELCDRQDAMIEAKSILEAEKEALRFIRCWVEEEARRAQARAKILEQASHRWNWNDESNKSQIVQEINGKDA